MYLQNICFYTSLSYFQFSAELLELNTDKVKLKSIISVEENDYSYFWKSIYFLNQKYKINEIPISLPSRELGYSKMKIKHIIYSLLTLLIFFFKEKIIKKIF